MVGLTRGNNDPGSKVRIMMMIPHKIPGILFLVSLFKSINLLRLLKACHIESFGECIFAFMRLGN